MRKAITSNPVNAKLLGRILLSVEDVQPVETSEVGKRVPLRIEVDVRDFTAQVVERDGSHRVTRRTCEATEPMRP